MRRFFWGSVYMLHSEQNRRNIIRIHLVLAIVAVLEKTNFKAGVENILSHLYKTLLRCRRKANLIDFILASVTLPFTVLFNSEMKNMFDGGQ